MTLWKHKGKEKSGVQVSFLWNCQVIELSISCCGRLQYGVKISLITSFKDTCFIEIVPKQHKSERGHYNSFFILKSHLAIVCIMLAYISSTNFVQGYGKQCIWTCLLTWKYMKMTFGLCTHWSESVLCHFLYLNNDILFSSCRNSLELLGRGPL